MDLGGDPGANIFFLVLHEWFLLLLQWKFQVWLPQKPACAPKTRSQQRSAAVAGKLIQEGSVLWPQVSGPATFEIGPLVFCNSIEDVNLGAGGDSHLFLPNRPGNREAFFPKREERKQKLSRKSSGGERGLSVYPKNVRSVSYQFPRPRCILGYHKAPCCPFPNL